MTHTLANGVRICTVEDIPAAAHSFIIDDELFYKLGDMGDRSFMRSLPSGNWTLLGRFEEITEEQWKGIVESIFDRAYKDYAYSGPAGYGYPFTLQTATASARSLIPGNPVVLIEKPAKN